MKHLSQSLFALLAAACLILAAMPGGTQAKKQWPLVSSAESRQLKFSHKLHVDENGQACEVCHANATASTSGFDDLLPTHAECATCHEVDDQNECSKCHLSASPSLSPRVNSYSEKFDHARHADKAELECSACHTDLDGGLPANSVGHLPNMAQCMSCHEQKLVKNECATCHMPYENLKPRDHENDWTHFHGAAAEVPGANCAMCHSAQTVANDCQSCHQGDPVLNPHPRNYVFRHGQDAHLSDMRCGECHEQRNFCSECHTAMNILPANHFKPGWVSASGGSHGEEAEFDLESCMSCHDRPATEPVCASCHGK